MRFNFPPTPAYQWLRQLADTFGADDVFTWTSNVDACFARSGFDPDRVYTTQVSILWLWLGLWLGLGRSVPPLPRRFMCDRFFND